MNSNNLQKIDVAGKVKLLGSSKKPIMMEKQQNRGETKTGSSQDSKLIQKAKNSYWSIGAKTPNEELAARGQTHRQGLQTTGQPISNPTLLHGIQNAFGTTCYLASFLQILATTLPEISEQETINPVFRAVRDARLSELNGKRWEALAKEILVYLGLDFRHQHCIDDTLSAFLRMIENQDHEQTRLERQLCRSMDTTLITKYTCDSHKCTNRGVAIVTPYQTLVVKGKLPEHDRPVSINQLVNNFGEWECIACRKTRATALESPLKLGTFLFLTVARNTGSGNRKCNQLKLSPVCRINVQSDEGIDTVVDLRLRAGAIHHPTTNMKRDDQEDLTVYKGGGHYTDFEFVSDEVYVVHDGPRVAKVSFDFIADRSRKVVILIFEVMPTPIEGPGIETSQATQCVDKHKPTFSMKLTMNPQRKEMIDNHQAAMVNKKQDVPLLSPNHAVEKLPRKLVREEKMDPTSRPPMSAWPSTIVGSTPPLLTPLVLEPVGTFLRRFTKDGDYIPPDLPTDTTGPVAAERPKERKGNAEQKMIKKNQKGGPSKSIRKQHAAHAPAVSNTPSEETRSKPRKVASKQSQRDKNRQSQREDQKSVAHDGWSIVPGHPPKRLRIIQEQVDDPNAYRSLRKVETPTQLCPIQRTQLGAVFGIITPLPPARLRLPAGSMGWDARIDR